MLSADVRPDVTLLELVFCVGSYGSILSWEGFARNDDGLVRRGQSGGAQASLQVGTLRYVDQRSRYDMDMPCD